MNKSKVSTASNLIDAKLEEHRLCVSKHCPNCGHKFDPKPDWVGLPAGVKFDPTDQELIEHLEAKVEGADNSRSHHMIDEFIPTIDGEDGICYTHPEKLPGVTRDGLSKHFFHRPSKAYTTGTRKRRKIQLAECDLQLDRGETRWHKTGKTRPVMVNGKQKGCKKILVLYTNFGKHRKPEKTNWVMHQYHLGELEEEKEGELVVSKIFYQTQPRQSPVPAAGAQGNTDQRRDSAGSGSCNSSREVVSQQRDHELSSGMEMHIKSDNFSFSPFRKSFDEVGMGDQSGKAERDHHKVELYDIRPPPPQQHHHVIQEKQHRLQADSAAAFHIARLTNPMISNMISPPPTIQQSSLVLDQDPYQVSRILLQSNKFQQQQQQQKMDHRSTSGLEEMIMGCTSAGIKGGSSIQRSTQDAEWQYSYWSPDHNQDHHG